MTLIKKLSCLLLAALSFASNAEDIVGRASVIDGDTLEIHGERIRFWGVDAFESSQLCERGGKQWPCGRVAANSLDRFIDGATVTCRPTGKKTYNRKVAKCEARGHSLNAFIVRQGLAVDWPQYSKGFYSQDEELARSSKVGAHAGTFQLPWTYRRAR